MTTTSDAWKRVGTYLSERRAQLGYTKRAPWARAVERPGFRARVITDLELAQRDNYSDDTLATAEEVYLLTPGSIRRAIATGTTPTPLEDTTQEAGPAETRIIDTPYGRVIEEIYEDLVADTEDWTEEEREEAERQLTDRFRLQYAELMRQTQARRDLDRRRKARKREV